MSPQHILPTSPGGITSTSHFQICSSSFSFSCYTPPLSAGKTPLFSSSSCLCHPAKAETLAYEQRRREKELKRQRELGWQSFSSNLSMVYLISTVMINLSCVPSQLFKHKSRMCQHSAPAARRCKGDQALGSARGNCCHCAHVCVLVR